MKNDQELQTKQSGNDCARFLQIALESVSELQTCFILKKKWGLTENGMDESELLPARAIKMIPGFLKAVS